MTKLFNKEDILTILTADKAKIGDNGYFGDSLEGLTIDVEHGEVHVLAKIYDEDFTLYPFKNDYHGRSFALFLPAGKVKKKVKKPVYRPIKTIDELFNFLAPSIANGKGSYSTLDKVGIILCTVVELKDKQLGNICYRRFSQIYLSDNYIRLDGYNLEHLFNNYEIKKDGEWQPFGIKEE